MFIAFVCNWTYFSWNLATVVFLCFWTLWRRVYFFKREMGEGAGGNNLIPVIFFNKKDSLRMKNELAPLSTEVTQRRTELVSIQSDIQVIDVYINQWYPGIGYIYYTVISRYRIYTLYINQWYPGIGFIHYTVISRYSIYTLTSYIQV